MASGAYKIKTVATPAITNALELKTWCESVMPSGATSAFFMRDNLDTSGFENNAIGWVVYINGAFIHYGRYRNGAWQSQAYFIVGYDAIINQGDNFTIAYQ